MGISGVSVVLTAMDMMSFLYYAPGIDHLGDQMTLCHVDIRSALRPTIISVSSLCTHNHSIRSFIRRLFYFNFLCSVCLSWLSCIA